MRYLLAVFVALSVTLAWQSSALAAEQDAASAPAAAPTEATAQNPNPADENQATKDATDPDCE